MSVVAAVRVSALRAPMTEPFEVATGAQTEFENLLVSLRLSDGATGYGECAPAPHLSSLDQTPARRRLERAARALEGLSAMGPETVCRRINELCPDDAPSRAALEMAYLDAWTRRRRLPLWVYFGGAGSTAATDITVPIVPPEQAGLAAARIRRRGVNRIKIKVGKEIDEDEARVRAVVKAAPRAGLIVDANQGYTPAEAVRLMRRLRKAGIRPLLYEQPVAKADIDGLAEVERKTGTPVAADESAATLSDVWLLAKRKACSVVNLKFMKFGIWEAWEAARAAKAAGLGLMMGGMVESRLAMVCAAHFAAGVGGFGFIDLDTPLWLARDPMSGGPDIGPGGVYELSETRGGVGCRPRAWALKS